MATGGTRLWDDYAPGESLDHPGGATLEEAEHMLATRLYQNTARIHFDAFAAKSNQFGKRLIYGGHIISLARALSHDGLENAFAIAAINGGAHTNPSFAGDTIYARSIVLERWEVPGRAGRGCAALAAPRREEHRACRRCKRRPQGAKHPDVVLDLDYTVLLPRR